VQRRLVAVSQYFDMCFFPSLVAREHSILELLKSFVAGIVERMPLESYVLDVYLQEREEARVLEGKGPVLDAPGWDSRPSTQSIRGAN
jgi:hypothetical protein